MKPFSALAAFFLLAFSASAQNVNSVTFDFLHRVGSEPLVVGQTVFEIWDGKKCRIDRAELYVSEVALRLADGSLVELPNNFILVNGDGQDKTADLGDAPVAAVTGARLGIGVPASVNHLDPTTWPPTHPLAPQNPSMHWGWAAGYRHMAVEGKIDLDGDGALESIFEFHNIFDPLFRSVELSGGAVAASDGVLNLRFALDWARLFDQIEMEGAMLFHGGEVQNVQMQDNAAVAEAFVSWPQTVSASDFLAEKGRIAAVPNPFSDAAQLEWNFEKSGDGLSLEIIDALGRRLRVFEKLPASGSLRLEGEGFEKGVFSAVFSKNGNVLGQKRLARF